MANLLEAYKNRLETANFVYNKATGGQLNESKKLVIAKCLENTDRFLNEAFANSVGTNRSDMGLFKKFSLNLTNIALPNLIAYDLVLVHPMSSMSGYISYLNYTYGSNKGNTKQGTVINNPFRLGDVDTNYTASTVASDFNFTDSTTKIAFDWKNVVPGTVVVTAGDDKYYDNGAGKLMKIPTAVSRRTVMTEEKDGVISGVAPRVEVTFTGGTEAGTVVYDGAEAGITLTTGITGAAALSYVYNNVAIPQNDLPILNAEMKAMPLVAKARRIAVYYSQISAFQAKTDYGFDLGDQLAEKAVGELSYEIDTEITDLLINNAAEDAELTWSKTLPVGVSKAEHYEGFTELVAIARQKIYDRTKRFQPNYMIIASNILPILGFAKGWSAAPAKNINGPYFAGTLDGLKVFVTPNIAPGKFVVGVNGDDMMTSAAVYAPYMPVVPTQLLNYADGGNSQGWSTLYALELLNKDLLVSGKVTA